ncbi:MAG: flagellar hook capping protein [Phycisphaerales bacterium]|jgi:flagellar basal-body rod modification protein FlgD|nr:flagellar hook capping protein [Phycisphaerales bacterium]MDB5299863.1 flagellar hook capping protein [Phycisphaerales bacterium]MDB5299882.1 flagellar hook capping protein [Phycisphaerales bacterium]MDB5305470.1 flagellar hook capping protein [Phycisphaerales bacterium]
MTTAPINNTTSSPNQLQNTKFNLKPQDFINMMVTQLQHQDPTQPASNSELLSQMSNIGQLESSTQLQTSLASMTLQNSIGAASSLIGKSVKGLDVNNNPIKGLVNSVQVQNNGVALQLDNGQSLDLARVTDIGAAPGPAQAGSATSAS